MQLCTCNLVLAGNGYFQRMSGKKFEDTKMLIRSRKSKKAEQCNGQKNKQ